MLRNSFPAIVAGIVCSALTLVFSAHAARSQSDSLADAYRTISQKDFVDLTHTFSPDIPHWVGFGKETVKTLYWYTPKAGTLGSGFFAQMYCHVGQWGTHVDAPAHFAKGGLTLDQIPPKDMVMPMVVIDVHDKVAKNPDYALTLDDVKAWESRHGPIPAHAFVAMRTDWSKRWPNAAAMENKDAHGVTHYPGWSMPVLKYLYDVRHITASGHETTDTDPGIQAYKNDFSLESWLLSHGHYQIEMLANLDKLPESGALAIMTFPKPAGGSGFPARAIAILP